MIAAGLFYQDEPIPKAPERTASHLPDRCREMRRMARCCSFSTASEAELFLRQGRFMEEFEDDCPYDGEFHRYFPSYQAMNDRQLRGYFTWRTRIRHGNTEAAPSAFALLYIYELLNGIGWERAEEGFRLLKEFRTAWMPFDPGIGRSLCRWMSDYVVYYDLDKSHLEELPGPDPDQPVLTLLQSPTCSADELFAALKALAPHPPDQSPFYRKHPEEMKEIIFRVYTGLEKRSGGAPPEKPPFGELRSTRYHMFGSALFCDPLKRMEFRYEINPVHRYLCENGNWSVERFFLRSDKLRRLETLLKAVEGRMRNAFGFSPALKEESLSAGRLAFIDKTIEQYREEKRRAAEPAIRIDLSRLGTIRRDAEEICEKLTVEDPDSAGTEPVSSPLEHPSPPPAEDRREENETAGPFSALDEGERQFLRCLLSGRPWKDLLRSERKSLAMMVDSINEKLFEHFNDTAIVCDGDTPELPEEYAEELKGEIGE